uniref:Vacuolar protein sorting-associated protein 13 VPS13 adaptor binding domain-containing protein n=1 Tax=Photinus pyralis TaxID=7054 RepID=A0A1Y1KIC3_PHOPY
MEHNEKTDLWVDLPPNQHKLFWPETGSMEMYVKYRDSKLNSQPFFIATVHHTVLRMDKGTAICVNVTGGTSGPFHVTFKEYAEGDAPILIKNMCADLFLKIQQQGQSPVTLLNPFTSLMYTWDDPIKPRQLLWNVYNNKGSGFFIDVFKDGYGEERINFHSVPSGSANPNKSSVESSSSEDSDTADSVKTTLNRKVRRDKIVVYWICYSDGLQKTLLFTQEQKNRHLYHEVIFNQAV